MNINDLKPVSQLAHNYGCKAIVFGAPGSGKSPVAITAPKPLMLVTEPGTLSMRKYNIPAFEAFDTKRIDDFFTWWFSSSETKQFDTLIIDSASQLADTYLLDAQKNNKHGLKAYGEMNEDVMENFRKLFFQKEKNVYLVCKEGNFDGVKRPVFPGKQLNVDVPHLYDMILHLGIHNVPQVGQVQSFQCNQTIDILARDRSGKLDVYEPPNFSAIVQKAMS